MNQNEADHQAVARGRRAATELTETGKAFADLKAATLARMIATPPEREATILKLHMVLNTIDTVEQAVRAVVSDGVFAEQALAAAGLTRPVD
ncbi:hypothetical protein [Caulobacter sp. NIBR2454]|uniref:hypothetical protein n=1 Tax=Caulobacter sp. NIBR2454 TaxID=3015996 RepID=UPI0022B637ED|nr:hypothetical protein [Caulobacter sp. NIBR2454]